MPGHGGGGGHSGGGHAGGYAGHGAWSHSGSNRGWNRGNWNGGWGWNGYGGYAGWPGWPGYTAYYYPDIYTTPYAGPFVGINDPGSVYGSCDCSVNGQVLSNNCNGNPVCTAGNCTCYNVPTNSMGCFNTQGAQCR